MPPCIARIICCPEDTTATVPAPLWWCQAGHPLSVLYQLASRNVVSQHWEQSRDKQIWSPSTGCLPLLIKWYHPHSQLFISETPTGPSPGKNPCLRSSVGSRSQHWIIRWGWRGTFDIAIHPGAGHCQDFGYFMLARRIDVVIVIDPELRSWNSILYCRSPGNSRKLKKPCHPQLPQQHLVWSSNNSTFLTRIARLTLWTSASIFVI